MNKGTFLVTPSVIEECLGESFDASEKKHPEHDKTQKTWK
ncbi:hypothetical protein L323_10865 [Ruminiclostridium papyrosolvens C7]|uniref:Uncharacterized protein n=1 Tax=Ruminiclostridium papyrosolvens C7 TaxID=1330534 RepID=U4R2F5_9FIRM|nr:hypothetical protein L323_10865 [Ruminiclostridium papyrosolvens C7]